MHPSTEKIADGTVVQEGEPLGSIVRLYGGARESASSPDPSVTSALKITSVNTSVVDLSRPAPVPPPAVAPPPVIVSPGAGVSSQAPRVLLRDDFKSFLLAMRSSVSDDRYRDLKTWLREFRAQAHAKWRDDFNADRVHKWIRKQMKESPHARYGHEGIGGTTAKKKLRGLRQAAKWMVETDRCAKDPLRGLRLPKKDVRRKRRSLLPVEVNKLVTAALKRPLADRTKTITRVWNGKTVTQDMKPKPAEAARLLYVGQARAFSYLLSYWCCLRKSEVRRLTWAHVESGRVELDADEQKAEDDRLYVPIPTQLHQALLNWRGGAPASSFVFEERHGRKRTRTGKEPALLVPTMSTMRKDLAAAGIDYQDSRFRFADFHAGRRSLMRQLKLAGVPAKDAQAILRDKDSKVFMENYSESEDVETLRGYLDRVPYELPNELRSPESVRRPTLYPIELRAHVDGQRQAGS